jgi:hypothetical protein
MSRADERSDPPPAPEDGAPRPDDRAPLLGTWPRWYALVVAMLIAWIALMGWLTEHFR